MLQRPRWFTPRKHVMVTIDYNKEGRSGSLARLGTYAAYVDTVGELPLGKRARMRVRVPGPDGPIISLRCTINGCTVEQGVVSCRLDFFVDTKNLNRARRLLTLLQQQNMSGSE